MGSGGVPCSRRVRTCRGEGAEEKSSGARLGLNLDPLHEGPDGGALVVHGAFGYHRSEGLHVAEQFVCEGSQIGGGPAPEER